MGRMAGVGYLAKVEANKVAVRPGPDVVYLRLLRSFPGEGEPCCMFAELTPGAALRLVRELQRCIRIAIGSAG